MSQAKPSLLPQGLNLQNPEFKNNDSKQCFEKQILPQQFNQDANNGQKRQQDNDYECEFKLVIKQKFKQKLKNDSTNELFTVIVNEIIEERIKRNFVADNGQANQPTLQLTENVDNDQNEVKIKIKGPSELQRLKAQDQQVKKKIKQIMKRRPKKKALTTYELDPNRDKGFILAKRMNGIKQQRQKKYISSKKEIEEQKKSLFQSQFATISCIENYSMHLAQKGSPRRYRKQSQDLQLPRINLNGNLRNGNESFRNSKSEFYDYLSQSRASTQKQIFQDGTSDNRSKLRYDNAALSARSNYSKSTNKKRDLLRQIQVLKRSQKITQKYQIKKIIHDILVQTIWNSVKIVESKKQFFHNAPPKPVHEMIRSFKDNTKRPKYSSGPKSQLFRINIHLKPPQKQEIQEDDDNMKNFETKSNVQNSSRKNKRRRLIQISLSNKSENIEIEAKEYRNQKNQKNVKTVSQDEKSDDQQQKKSQKSNNMQIPDNQSELVLSQKQDDLSDVQNLEQKKQ